MNNLEFLIPIVLFVCITLAIKFIVDARLRRRFAETNASEELIKGMLQADETSRRLSALKWGLVLTLQGLAFGLIQGLHLEDATAGVIGLVMGAAGVGLLSYHAIARRFG
jgi:hypothetical protein